MKLEQHDFSAIDKHIAWEQYKKAQLLNKRLAENWASWAKVTFIFLLSFGVLAILLAIAIFIYKNANEPIKFFSFSNSTVSEKDIQLVMSEIKKVNLKLDEIKDKNLLTEEEILRKIKQSEQDSKEEDSLIDTTFTVFETSDDVVTGRVYSPSNLNFPIKQYCYRTLPIESAENKSIREDLANKEESGDINYLGQPNSEITKLAMEKCSFMEL